jgi:hypothetical protein
MNKRTAIFFVVLLGCVSLFGDVTYEGARSIVGPYLGALGATGTIIGIAAGAGELAGYGIRLASGFLTDKSKQYWPLTIAGYVINLAAVPLLALAGNWQIAVSRHLRARGQRHQDAGAGCNARLRDASDGPRLGLWTS